MRRKLAFLAFPLMLAGCGVYYTEYWARPGGTEAEFEIAASKCENDAVARFPPVTLGQPGYFSTPQTWCTPTAAGINCTPISPGYLPQAQSAADTNEVPRESAFRACLLAGGWHPSGPDDGPIVPASSGLPETAVSKALAYCESIHKLKPNVMRTAASRASFDQCVMTRARELSGPRPPA